MSRRETVTVEKSGNAFFLCGDSSRLTWPKALRPPNPDDYVGRQLQITHGAAGLESVSSSEAGMEFERIIQVSSPSPKDAGRDRPGSRRQSPASRKGARSEHNAAASTQQKEFINPYSFVPFAGRPADNPKGLEPGPPAGHDRFVPGTHTGVLSFTLTTVTPLLLVDQSRAQLKDNHKVLPSKVGNDGLPRLPASAVRGMLRSAYEAVTNSAFGVVDRHWDEPLTKGKRKFKSAPAELADGHMPSKRLAELTPAERVFGWIREDQSYAGQIRLEQPKCTTDGWDGRGKAHTPLELAVLASPKPTYYRFYLEGDDTEQLFVDGGYVSGGHLRGWKTYVHHRGAPVKRSDFEKYVGVRRYKYKNKEQPGHDVTLSVQNWVAPAVEFQIRLRVQNLTDVEFGGLLWLLYDDQKPPRFRLGLGKPLGFGTVEASDVEWTPLCPESRYGGQKTEVQERSLDVLRDKFAGLWSSAGHLDAYRRAMAGWDSPPVHYPQVEAQNGDTPAGQPGYLWFQENEKYEGRRKWLPELAVSAPALPVYRNALKDVSDVGGKPSNAGRTKGRAASGAPKGQQTRKKGQVKFFDAQKGYGFIIPDDGGRDVYFRRGDVKDGTVLKSDQKVEFDLGYDNNKPRAKNVRIARG